MMLLVKEERVGVTLYPGDDIVLTFSIDNKITGRHDTEVLRYKAEKRVDIDCVRLYYIENEFGFANGYMMVMGKTDPTR